MNTKGRTTGLILVLIGLLLIISAVVLFAMQQGLIGGMKASGSDNQRPYSAVVQQCSYVDQQHRITIMLPNS